MKAEEARGLVVDGIAPRHAPDRATAEPTFGELADKHIETMGPSRRNPKHRARWQMTSMRQTHEEALDEIERLSDGDRF